MDLRTGAEIFNFRRYGDGPFQTEHVTSFPPEFLPRLMHPACLLASWTTATRTLIELPDRDHPAVVLRADGAKPRHQGCGPQFQRYELPTFILVFKMVSKHSKPLGQA